MKRLIPTILLCVAATASFAQKMDSFDYIVSDIRIMQDRKVQNELGVNAAQRAQMNRFADGHRQRVLALENAWKGQKPTPEQQKQIELRLVGYMSDLKKSVCGVLTPAQLKRLREITLQGYGWAALADDRVARRVGASPAQIKRIRTALQTAQSEASAVQKKSLAPVLAHYRGLKPKSAEEAKRLDTELQAKLREAGRKDRGQLVAIQNQTLVSIKRVLMAKQRSTFESLMGRKYAP